MLVSVNAIPEFSLAGTFGRSSSLYIKGVTEPLTRVLKKRGGGERG